MADLSVTTLNESTQFTCVHLYSKVFEGETGNFAIEFQVFNLGIPVFIFSFLFLPIFVGVGLAIQFLPSSIIFLSRILSLQSPFFLFRFFFFSRYCRLYELTQTPFDHFHVLFNYISEYYFFLRLLCLLGVSCFSLVAHFQFVSDTGYGQHQNIFFRGEALTQYQVAFLYFKKRGLGLVNISKSFLYLEQQNFHMPESLQ